MTTTTEAIAVPVLRFGREYESLDTVEVKDLATGELRANMSIANAGIIRRDMRNIDKAFAKLQSMSVAELIDICKCAGELFLNGELPMGENATQTPDDYVQMLSSTSGLPHNMCRGNMSKVHHVFDNMDEIIRGLTRGMDTSVIDRGFGEQGGTKVSYYPTTKALGAVLPSNSPGVNSIWLPSIALKIPVVIKPGSEEPWTPYRIIQAFIAAGVPSDVIGFYPTTHEGSATVMELCDRAIIFGDQKTVERYAGNPSVSVHGPGWSKVILGDDVANDWEKYLDIMVDSVAANGGRSCINASCVITPRYGRELADALAQRLAAYKPTAPDDPDAKLSAFAKPQMAEFMNEAIKQGLKEKGAEEMTAGYREGERLVQLDGRTYLQPTLVYCEKADHPLANTEYMFPYASVVEMSNAEALKWMGQSLVVSAITKDQAFERDLLACPLVDRLNIGALPTSRVTWDQPHEGNLFEFLYRRRAIQRSSDG